MRYQVEVNGRLLYPDIHRADGQFHVTLDGREWVVDAARIDAHTISLLIGSVSREVTTAREGASGQQTMAIGTVPLSVIVNGRRRWGRKDDSGVGRGPQKLMAPMPGKVVRVLARRGTAVNARQPLVVIEAMKMENELRATGPGVVTELLVQEGQSVDAGALLLVVTPE